MSLTGFWEALGQEQSCKIFQKIENECFEKFDNNRTNVYKLCAQPYPNASVYRLVFRNQWAQNTKHKDRKFSVPGGAVSHIIVTDADHSLHPDRVICIGNNGQSIQTLNIALDLQVTKDNVDDYIVFFGQILQSEHGSFNFITKRNYIPDPSPEMSGATDKLALAIESIFRVQENGSYNLNIREKIYPVIGRAFLMDVPTVYSGALFSTDLRVSDKGIIEMDQDDPTAVDGIYQLMPPTQYYQIDNSSYVNSIFAKSMKKLNKPLLLVAIPQIFEKSLGFLTFPLFSIAIFIIFLYGVNNKIVFYFLELISKSNFINSIALIIGFAMVVGSVVRFFLLEFGRLTSSFVPNQFTSLFGEIKRQSSNARGKIGLIWFLFLTSIEFLVIPIQAATIFSYGVINIFLSDVSVNFIESLLFVILSIPFISFLLIQSHYFSGSFGLYNLPIQPIFSWIVSVFFVSVILGVAFRIILISKKDD